jgi:hypothetical protein
MANTAKAITSDTMVTPNMRVIKGTLGADGALPVAERLSEYDCITIQLTGTPNSSVQTVQVSNGGMGGTFTGLPTAVAFSNTTGFKTVTAADMGFDALQFSGASAGGSSDLAFIVIASRRGKRS